MKSLLNRCLSLSCKAVGVLSLFLAFSAVDSMSIAWMYEPEMPTALRPEQESM